MPTRILALPAAEAISLLRAESEAAHGQPELNTSAWKDYVIEEDFDRGVYGIHDGAEFDLVTSVATLNIEPRVERDYWILRVIIERVIGPLPVLAESTLDRTELTLDEFSAEMGVPGPKRTLVRLDVETPIAKEHFDHWLAEMRARHAGKAPAAEKAQAATGGTKPAVQNRPEEVGEIAEKPTWIYSAREVVGVFRDPAAFEAAVEKLETSGFDRAAISVLATRTNARQSIEGFYRTVAEIEDSGEAPRGAFVSRDSRTEAEVMAVGIPLYIGGAAGAFAVVATGGALAFALAAAVAGGAAAGGLGALLARSIARQHRAHVDEQLKKGGLILWVSVGSPDAEKRALAVFEEMGARDAHVHQIEREWGVTDIPFARTQPDPFLERDR